MREIERLTATNHHRQHMNPHKSSKAFPQDHARTVESEQIFSLQCQTEQAVGQMANHKSFLNDFGALNTSSRQPTRKVGGAGRDRTDDILLAKQALSQLSYGP
jgi:hypothetical protein